ncbi:MAG: class I SAM-dependent methyltransferase [Thermodesulfobacteriota bacterium]
MEKEDAKFDYEIRRFGRSRRGHRMNRSERNITQSVLGKLPPHSLVLDIPCGLGRFTDLLIDQGHRYVGMDINFDYARYASERLKTPLPALQASIFELPLSSNSVDFVMSIRMFHHFQSDQIIAALKEISRVAPQALVTFYNRRSWRIQKRRFSLRIRRREWRGGESWHEKTYSLREMKDFANQAGMRVKEKISSLGLFTSNQFLWLERS